MRGLTFCFLTCFWLVIGCGETSPPVPPNDAVSVDTQLPGPGDTAAPRIDTSVPATDTYEPASDTLTTTDTLSPPEDTEPAPQEDATPDAVEKDAPTWWTCRRALTTNALTPELEATCNLLHSKAPSHRMYGIRWIVIDEKLDLAAWRKPRLDRLNQLFASAGFSFTTSSEVTVKNPVFTDPKAEGTFSLESLTEMTAQLLGIEATSPQQVLDVLKQRLQDTGVTDNATEQLTLDKALNGSQYLMTIARADPEQIHIIVSPLLNGTSAAGMSSGPGTNPTNRQVSVVFMRSAPAAKDTVLAHEMGHFMGLTHPHARLDEEAEVAPTDLAELTKNSPFETSLLVEALKSHLGDSLDGEPPMLFVPWNGKQKDELQPFERYRYGISRIWVVQERIYRLGTDGPELFPSLAAFIEGGLAGETVYYKNFTAPGTGNNCSWSNEQGMFMCDIGSPPSEFLGTDPLVDGTLFFGEGQQTDLMSYIGKTIPNDLFDGKLQFSSRAIPTLMIHAHTPVRLMLRNYAL